VALQVGLQELQQGGLGQCALTALSDPFSLDDMLRKNFARTVSMGGFGASLLGQKSWRRPRRNGGRFL
jgi:hypothetical protein